MIEFIWDNKFKRKYKKRISENADLKYKFIASLNTFSRNPFEPKLKTHKLSGTLKDCRAFSVDYDCGVIFKFIDKKKSC
jgi:mRNA-degrading endonuclease YafQ of YafQ-DinJ toxin-antitoxin module